jgi:transcriptional regulator with XRE-family HTH domain
MPKFGISSSAVKAQKTRIAPAPDDAQKLVAKNMRRIRIEQLLTQEQVADLSGTTPVWISGCERGVRNLSLSSLSMIAFALGVDMRDLLDTAKHAMPPAGKRVYSRRVAKSESV